MKIGFSFGRCVRDIVKGIVKQEDVLCIIARTRMMDEDHVVGVIDAYMHEPGYLLGLDFDTCKQVGLDLFLSGKILEPRANGISVMQVPKEYVWMDLYPTVANVSNQGLKTAWESYRMLIELCEQVPEGGDSVVYRHSDKQREPTDEEVRKAAQLLQNFI